MSCICNISPIVDRQSQTLRESSRGCLTTRLLSQRENDPYVLINTRLPHRMLVFARVYMFIILFFAYVDLSLCVHFQHCNYCIGWNETLGLPLFMTQFRGSLAGCQTGIWSVSSCKGFCVWCTRIVAPRQLLLQQLFFSGLLFVFWLQQSLPPHGRCPACFCRWSFVPEKSLIREEKRLWPIAVIPAELIDNPWHLLLTSTVLT